MKKLVLLLGIMLFLVSCKGDDQEFAKQSTFSEAETPTIEHVSIPLTNSQLLELFHSMSPLAQTRVVVFNLFTETEVKYWSTTGPGVLVVYFGAFWHGPSLRYGQIFSTVANMYTNKECFFAKIDYNNADPKLLSDYRIQVMPTTLIIKYNQVVIKVVGIIEETKLRALVDEYKAHPTK